MRNTPTQYITIPATTRITRHLERLSRWEDNAVTAIRQATPAPLWPVLLLVLLTAAGTVETRPRLSLLLTLAAPATWVLCVAIRQLRRLLLRRGRTSVPCPSAAHPSRRRTRPGYASRSATPSPCDTSRSASRRPHATTTTPAPCTRTAATAYRARPADGHMSR